MARFLIVGAGPSGLSAGRLLATQGHEVVIIEEHSSIGEPVQCTGLLTDTVFKFLPRRDLHRYIVNTLHEVEVRSQNNSAVIPVEEYVIDRQKFDSYLAGLARKAGCEILTGHKLLDFSRGSASVSTRSRTETFSFDYLIGADGPNSLVARLSGMYRASKFMVGSQAIVKGSFNSRRFTTFFGSGFPGFFGWIVPESDSVARVGYAGKNVGQLDVLLEGAGEVLARQGGLIPVYSRRRCQKGNVFLVGDAAGLVKNTTGGGIISGIRSAHALALSFRCGRSYRSLLSSLRRELFVHRVVRSFLDRFSDRDYDLLLSYVKDSEVKEVLRNNSRDDAVGLCVKLVAKKPSLLRFAFVSYGTNKFKKP